MMPAPRHEQFAPIYQLLQLMVFLSGFERTLDWLAQTLRFLAEDLLARTEDNPSFIGKRSDEEDEDEDPTWGKDPPAGVPPPKEPKADWSKGGCRCR